MYHENEEVSGINGKYPVSYFFFGNEKPLTNVALVPPFVQLAELRLVPSTVLACATLLVCASSLPIQSNDTHTASPLEIYDHLCTLDQEVFFSPVTTICFV